MSALLPLSACSLEGILPELDGNAGSATQHVQAVLHPPKTRSLPPGLQGVELQVKDVLMRRSSDKSWNILNDKPALWILGDHAAELPTFSAIPMPVDTYDAVRVVLGEAFVIQGGQRLPMALTSNELTLEGQWNLSTDQGLDVWINVDNAITAQATGWQASPALEIATRLADFSSESLKQPTDEKDGQGSTAP